MNRFMAGRYPASLATWMAVLAVLPRAAAQDSGAQTSRVLSPEVMAVLDRIEQGDRELENVTAQLTYSVLQELKANPDDPAEVQNFFGTVKFIAKPLPRQFFIHFDHWNDGRLKYDQEEWFIFDGEWLTHANEKGRTITREQITRPGEQSDLFKLGRGPFPLPFAQKKDDILDQFFVTLVSPSPDAPPGSDHLICIPKPGSDLEETYSKIEIFVAGTERRDLSGLPIKLIAHNIQQRTRQTAVFETVKKNVRLKPEREFQLPAKTRGWDVQEQPLSDQR